MQTTRNEPRTRGALSRRDEANIRAAIKAATRSPYVRWKLGAVGTRNRQPIAHATNRQRNSPQFMTAAGSVAHVSEHAEEALLRSWCGPIDTVYVARVAKDGQPALAKPCPRCEQQLRARGVRRVVFTTGPASADTMLLT